MTSKDILLESVRNILNEGRPSKQHPIEGHAYHSKSDAELRYIIKDAGDAAKAMKDHSPHAESKYLDQVNDASTVLSYRKRNGTPDWYKQKYKLKEEVELDEAKKGYVDKNFGKPPKEVKSPFKEGQRVAVDYGMGKTKHGNVTNPASKSGGKMGASIKFGDGTSAWHPHGEIKDASQYWKDADEKMRKERNVKEATECRVCGQTPCNCTHINESSNIKVGDSVHVGHVQKGGSGYRGVVTKIDGGKVHFRSEEEGKFGHRQYVGQLKNASKLNEEAELKEQYVVYSHDGKYNKIKKVVTNHATAKKHAEKLGGDHKVASMEYWQDKLAPKTNEDVEINEAIKGWKNAHSDIMKHRSEQGKDVVLHSLKKDGTESGMHDARKTFKSEEEAVAYHKRVRELNPKRDIKHNLYINGKHEGLLAESFELSEVSAALLARYKTAARADASKADSEGNFERGNKRFSGIIKATNKQFEKAAQKKANLGESLSKSASVSDWVDDFVNSDDPKFKGKTKAERIKMALGAYYGQQNEEVQLDEISSELRDKVRNARSKAYDDSQRSTGKWLPKSGDPEKLKKLQRNTRLNSAHFKRTVIDKLPKMTNADYVAQADDNRKKGWSNESVETNNDKEQL